MTTNPHGKKERTSGHFHAKVRPARRPRAVSAFHDVDAAALVSSVRARLQREADDKNVDVVLHCEHAWVHVQPLAFEEVLYGLLGAAVLATRRGHPVVVDVRAGRDGGVHIQVQDTGEGVILRDEAGEAGRGDALAVIERHGGSLSFESARGVGTTVSVWVPSPASIFPEAGEDYP